MVLLRRLLENAPSTCTPQNHHSHRCSEDPPEYDMVPCASCQSGMWLRHTLCLLFWTLSLCIRLGV